MILYSSKSNITVRYNKVMKKTTAKTKKSTTSETVAEALNVRIQKSQTRFKRVRNPEGPDIGIGNFFLLIDITASLEDIYIPLSIASGKKTTGFVYQIEGTAQGSISTTDISCSGKGVTQVTLGTILYAKIPKGMTATFRIVIEIRGRMNNSYAIGINRIHYKYNPSDARYEKYLKEIRSTNLKLS